MAWIGAAAWILPIFFWPWWGHGWEVFFVGKATVMTLVAHYAPWWRGRWTGPETALVAGLVLWGLHAPSAWGLGRSLVWVSGWLLLRALRGLPEGQRAFLRRWWWASLPLAAGYWALQVLRPGWDPWPRLDRTLPASSTFGLSGVLCDALMAAAFAGPWPFAPLAVLVAVVNRARGPLLAGLVTAALFRRWAWLILGLTGMVVLLAVRPPDLSWSVRAEIWHRTVGVIRAHWLLGVGTGRYAWAVDQAPIPGEGLNVIGAAHGEYLERAAEWGLPGGLLFAAWVAARCRRSAGATALALGALTGFTFHHPAGWAMFCILAGMEEMPKRWVPHGRSFVCS